MNVQPDKENLPGITPLPLNPRQGIVTPRDVRAETEPPTELQMRREKIRAAVEAASDGVIADIKGLRKQLDELETLVLQNSARVTDNLNTHVDICEAAQIETNRLSGIVAKMRKNQISHINERTGHA
jgi:hypothetical protein